MATKTARKKAKKGLLLEHLEDISWRVLEEYPSVVNSMIRKRSGVYALYRRGRLYYVGLASNLTGRLKTHLKDRHESAWDRFSVFITADSEHVKELESLLLRIVKPEGNRVVGGFAGSSSLRSVLNSRITQFDADRRARLLGGVVAKRRRRTKARNATGSRALKGVLERRTQLRAVFKGAAYKASLRTDGSIQLGKNTYASPSAAARAVVGRGCAGWKFWKYKGPNGKWVPLATLRG